MRNGTRLSPLFPLLLTLRSAYAGCVKFTHELSSLLLPNHYPSSSTHFPSPFPPLSTSFRPPLPIFPPVYPLLPPSTSLEGQASRQPSGVVSINSHSLPTPSVHHLNCVSIASTTAQHTLHAVLRINKTHCLRPFPRAEIRRNKDLSYSLCNNIGSSASF